MTNHRSTLFAVTALLCLAVPACDGEDKGRVDATGPVGQEPVVQGQAGQDRAQPRAGTPTTPMPPPGPARDDAGSAIATPSPAGSPGQGSLPVADYCPMMMAGVKLEVSDAPNAVVMSFTTPNEDDVAELRQRARNLGQMYEAHSGRPAMDRGMGMHGGQGQAGQGQAGQGQGGQGQAGQGQAGQGQGGQGGMGQGGMGQGGMGQGGMGQDKGGMGQDKGAMGQGKGAMGQGKGGMGQDKGMQRAGAPNLHTTFTEIDKGARLELMPEEDAKLDELRTYVRNHEQRMRKGQCQIMLEDELQQPQGGQEQQQGRQGQQSQQGRQGQQPQQGRQGQQPPAPSGA